MACEEGVMSPDAAKAELLTALLVERYDNRWWKTPEPDRRPIPAVSDDDLAGIRRRNALLAEWDIPTNAKEA